MTNPSPFNAEHEAGKLANELAGNGCVDFSQTGFDRIKEYLRRAHDQGKAEALEESAALCDQYKTIAFTGEEFAKYIRSLKPHQKGDGQ